MNLKKSKKKKVIKNFRKKYSKKVGGSQSLYQHDPNGSLQLEAHGYNSNSSAFSNNNENNNDDLEILNKVMVILSNYHTKSTKIKDKIKEIYNELVSIYN